MPAPFSRLQLAAALIEYDNDANDESSPRRSAKDSAIFLPFRNTAIRPPPPERRSTDYLGVTLPIETETGSIAPGRDSVAFDRRSRASFDALRNPFARESTYDGLGLEDDDEEDLEVDLASWGLDALVPKEKDKTKRKRNKSETLPNPHDIVPSSKPHARTMSTSMLNGLGEGGAFLESQSSAPLGPRRHSIGDPLDAPQAHSTEPIFPPRARSPSAHALIDNLQLSAPLHSVPFPSSETVRSPSPQLDDRRRSLSFGSRAMFSDEIRPSSRASRLDLRGHSSSGSVSKMLNDPQAEDDNPFALRPPSPSRMSRFDPKAQRARTTSHGSLATQMMLDDEHDYPGPEPSRPSMGERGYSRMDLMRPKVLIMPSPLQSVSQAPAGPPTLRTTEGFELSTDGRPLPPGARTARRSSMTLSVIEPGLSGPVASNSFTPNPRSSLTLSQLIFRNNLMVDGQRDVAYADIDNRLKRATEDGQQIEDEPEPVPVSQPDVPVVEVDEPTGPKRPAGKLYGRSLIDNLESRKAEMRGKQRVFRGDDRPSMMARTQPKRSSTLIAPEELKRPASQHLNSYSSQPNLTRRNSANAKPLLDFGDEIPGAPRQSLHPGGGGGNTRTVFGVDTLWERELSKLKIIEEQEREAEEERRRREAEDEARGVNKKGKKKKGKGKEKDVLPGPISPAAQTPSPPPLPESTSAPPVLPVIPKTIVRRAPPPPANDAEDDDSDEDSDASDAPAPARAQASGWHSDDDGPRRTTGTGPRYPNKRLPQMARPDGESSSEEDVPLVATIGRAAQRQASRAGGGDSSDEEQPLSVLLDKTKQRLPSVSGGSLSSRSRAMPPRGADVDEDDTPLGLRVSRLNPVLGGGEDEDDKPLGLHPDQLRKSQFIMTQQQQQQQMFAQAQMAAAQQSMIFGAPSMMSSGFFGPPMAPPQMMMYSPQLPPTPPPMQDASKFGRVDKWRHDVAVEGERS